MNPSLHLQTTHRNIYCCLPAFHVYKILSQNLARSTAFPLGKKNNKVLETAQFPVNRGRQEGFCFSNPPADQKTLESASPGPGARFQPRRNAEYPGSQNLCPHGLNWTDAAKGKRIEALVEFPFKTFHEGQV